MAQAYLARAATGRKVAGSVCLVAALLLWGPLWATAWEADGKTCCAGAMCPAHQHSKHSQDYPKPADPSDSSMLCEHHGNASIAPCSMSCCRTDARYFVASIVFLLPQTVALWGSSPSAAQLNFGPEHALLSSIAPPDQPPRSLTA